MPIEWIQGLAGGLMIGCAAALLLLGNGRIMGASGILSGLLTRPDDQTMERLVFVGALIAIPAMLGGFLPVETNATASPFLLILGGLAVGIGTRVGSGCTSGHGVCGISRLSLRGIIATLIYMGAGIVTVTALRLIWGV